MKVRDQLGNDGSLREVPSPGLGEAPSQERRVVLLRLNHTGYKTERGSPHGGCVPCFSCASTLIVFHCDHKAQPQWTSKD